MPFGKKALTPQAHTQGVGDEAHVAEILEFLGPRGSRLMCPLMTRDALGRVVVEDGLFRLQRPGRGFQAERAVAEEDFKRLQWLQPRNSQVFRSFCATAARVRARTPTHAPARARTTANQAADGATPPDAVQAARTLSFTHAAACVGRFHARAGPGGQ